LRSALALLEMNGLAPEGELEHEGEAVIGSNGRARAAPMAMPLGEVSLNKTPLLDESSRSFHNGNNKAKHKEKAIALAQAQAQVQMQAESKQQAEQRAQISTSEMDEVLALLGTSSANDENAWNVNMRKTNHQPTFRKTLRGRKQNHGITRKEFESKTTVSREIPKILSPGKLEKDISVPKPRIKPPRSESRVILYVSAAVLAICCAIGGIIWSELRENDTKTWRTVQAPVVRSKPFFHTVRQGEKFEFDLDIDEDESIPSPSFQWRLNGVIVSDAANSKKLSIEEVELRHAGTYTCLVENSEGKFHWEEGYVNVETEENEGSTRPKTIKDFQKEMEMNVRESAAVQEARTCLLKSAPSEILRAAISDGGSAVIAAGGTTGYLETCFPLLSSMVSSENLNRALDLLRSMHGTSKQRSLLVNVLVAMEEFATDRTNPDLYAKLAFQTGVFCASTPYCSEKKDDARTRVVQLVLKAIP